MLTMPATRVGGAWALFLDVDGTLLELAETPQGVRVPDSLKKLLSTLSLRLDGALALISGRSLADLDNLFAPLRVCAAGVHGFERRDGGGRVVRPPLDSDALENARCTLREFVSWHEGILLEDKGCGLALHFRRVPHMSADVDRVVRMTCERLGREFVVQPGKCVFEIRPASCTKGGAIRAFMQHPPFCGRMPIYMGDDVTDEDGFAVVNELGGISIKVGEGNATLAQYRLPGVRQVLRWLESVPWPNFAHHVS